MAHPLIVALFSDPARAAGAARDLRALGIPQDRVSIVARSHDEEGALARATDASPGSEMEDSRPASRIAELTAHLVAAVALVMPGIGPIVADGPLAAGLGEAAGHAAGDLGRILQGTGIDRDRAEAWERRIERGEILVGAHCQPSQVTAVRDAFFRNGAADLAEGRWPE
jgi:hypothetical protein